MAHQYAKIAFTDTVRQVQTEQNSREGYARMDAGEDYNYLLSSNEAEFIAKRDSFYMASVSETDWPYVQHRGGPQGFLKVFDAQTIGFADFKGNRQYVSTGNFRTNSRVSIILMDYPNRRRLKILGNVTQVADDDWETQALLEGEPARNSRPAAVERGFIIKIVAFDWNCPQFITPRYTESQLNELLEPLAQQVTDLQQQLVQQQLVYQAPITAIGDGELALKITGVRQLTPQVRAFELRTVNGDDLPKISAGAHIQVPIEFADGKLEWRNYSISSNPNRCDCYEIAVKVDERGNGGSVVIHQQYQLGMTLHCKMPDNFFPLKAANNNVKPHYVLIAGGIGITAIKSMALELLAQNASFEVHYAGQSKQSMAYLDRLTRQLDTKLMVYIGDDIKGGKTERLSLNQLMANRDEHTQFYCCGPSKMLEDFIDTGKRLGIDKLYYEQFSAATKLSGEAIAVKACEVYLSQSNKRIAITAEQSVLDGLLSAGVNVPFSCKTGDCKSCVVTAQSNDGIEHKDNCLTEQERADGKMCLCVSRPKGDELVVGL